MGETVLPALNYMVRLYGRNYSKILEKSKSSTLRFYASIESRYGGNRFMVVVPIRNRDFFVAPTVYEEVGYHECAMTGQVHYLPHHAVVHMDKETTIV